MLHVLIFNKGDFLPEEKLTFHPNTATYNIHLMVESTKCVLKSLEGCSLRPNVYVTIEITHISVCLFLNLCPVIKQYDDSFSPILSADTIFQSVYDGKS